MERVDGKVLPGRPVLPRELRGPLFTAATVTALVAIVLGVSYAGSSTAGSLDAWARGLVADASDRGRDLAFLVDFSGEPVGALLLVSLLTVLCLVLRRYRLAALAVASPVPAALTTVLKPVVDRTINGDFLAFPSGHTALAAALGFVFGLLVADLFKAGRTPSTLVVLGGTVLTGVEMGWAQVTLNAHYATDTLGGLCVSVAVMPVLARVTDVAADRFTVGDGTRA